MLYFNNYKKNYSAATVVTIPELQLTDSVYWLQGENGSGKTTLLKSIAGLIPFDGRIMVDGISIHTQRMAYKKIVNYAEAEPVYPPFLTGSDLLHFYNKTKGALKEGTIQFMQAIGIAKLLDQKTGTYSSGMLKKLSLVLAFVGKPKLILLDEPLITLDVDAATILQNKIAEAVQDGVSFIVTSHQPFTNFSFPVSPLFLKNGTINPA